MGLEIVTIEKEALKSLLREIIQEELGQLKNEEELLSVEEAAQILRVTPQTIYKRKRAIGFIKEGKHIRFTRRDIANYLALSKID